MNICGMQKMSLVDYPGRVAATIFLGGCNLRCPYCHNSELWQPEAEPVMSEEDLIDFLKKRRGLIDGVCISGGEPLLQPDLEELIVRIREVGYPIKLDTNGTLPDRLMDLCSKGLVDYVAMDIKAPVDKLTLACGLPLLDIKPILDSAGFLMDQWGPRESAGAGPETVANHEFRTTLVEELMNEEDIRQLGKWLKGARRLYLQSFTDRPTVPYAGLHAPSPETVESYAAILREYIADVIIR